MPLKWKLSGTSPSSSAWKYFAVATSRSYVHGTSSANTVEPLNAGTTVATRIHDRPWVDGVQLAGRPEQLGEPLAGPGVVSAAGRVDHHLGGERDRLDLVAGRVRHAWR